MKQYKLGIIGGMGPEATVNFYNMIVSHTVSKKDQDHIDMIILNHASLMDRTYAIKKNLKNEFINQISEDIKILENIGVDNITIPCNTCHTMFDDIQSLTKIPIINMIEETVKNINESKKVGIMGTDGTIISNLYQSWCEKYNVSYFIPNKEVQNNIMDIIYNDIKANGFYDYKKFSTILDYFLSCDCSKVILACTELSGFYSKFNFNCIDPMACLAKKAIENSGRMYKA